MKGRALSTVVVVDQRYYVASSQATVHLLILLAPENW